MELRKIMKFNLRRILIERGYEPSGQVLADLMGSTKQYWSKIISDEHKASLGPAQRKNLAVFFKIDESEFIKPIPETSTPSPPLQSNAPPGIDPIIYLLTQVAAKLDQVIESIKDNGERRHEVVEAIQTARTNTTLNCEKIIEAVKENKNKLEENTEVVLKAITNNKPFNERGSSRGESIRRRVGTVKGNKKAG